jgi:hypothetical protein
MSKPETIRIDDVEYIRKDAATDLQPIEQQRKDNPDWPWKLGQKYMIRTVTFHDCGVLVGVTDNELVLQKAAWVADSGRWWNFITGKSKPNEVEPFHPDRLVIIGRGAIIDATQLDVLYGDQK